MNNKKKRKFNRVGCFTFGNGTSTLLVISCYDFSCSVSKIENFKEYLKAKAEVNLLPNAFDSLKGLTDDDEQVSECLARVSLNFLKGIHIEMI